MRLRSLLSLPAIRLEWLGKARTSGSDIFESVFEDGIGPEDSLAARRAPDDLTKLDRKAHESRIASMVVPKVEAMERDNET
ncbi:hypothetical protein [Tropicimonas sp. IMCC6043]|uniref:hypothetical protein n=1 Tax=Tropicimonas sp. IMCC6043 TaxID=2510645 RepID=UPI00101CFB9F|nr:hypothetical protein [Tropicimonas sp. IMCC6043]RYH06804.1 hypothetical protein EU800_22570 [Tropicimonas sp. IMCC6043]